MSATWHIAILETTARERREVRCWADQMNVDTEMINLWLNIYDEDAIAEYAWDDVKLVELDIWKKSQSLEIGNAIH